jgi:hypothetical protein
MRCLVFCLLLISASFVHADDSFTQSIAPLLVSKCIKCHSGTTPKGDLDLTSSKRLREGGSTGSVLPGTGSKGLMWDVIDQRKMPPKEKLSEAEQATLKRWLETGAKWEGPALQLPGTNQATLRAETDWWSLQPIRRPVVPTVKQAAWERSPIDAFIAKALEDQGLSPSPETDRRTYLRRVKFDLLGLPATPEEVEAFQKDQSADAYEKLVDRYLASPHYGERWGRHWLDVVRFAESHGYETNELRRNAWPFRDWVIRSFNDDKPFTRFVQEQLAGDVVAKGDALNEVATGFLVAGTHDIVGNQTPEGMAQQRQDDLYDMVSTTGATFLGLTVNCARCHDHKFDPISQRDYYGMQAIFAGVEHASRTINDPVKAKQVKLLEGELTALVSQSSSLEQSTSMTGKPIASLNTEVFPKTSARFVRFTVLATERGDDPCIDELEIYAGGKNVALASLGSKATASSEYPNSDIHRIQHLNDGKVGNSHSWISKESASGWAQIEFANVQAIDRVVWGRDRLRRFTDRLPSKYKIEVSLDGKEWKLLCTEADRLTRTVTDDAKSALVQLKAMRNKQKAKQQEIDNLRSEITIYCGHFKKPEKVHLLKRGDPMQKLDEVSPTAITSLNVPINVKASSTDAERRLALANWITDPANPLPARVMANRLWHYHFGTGIVNTPSDFGFNGGKPSHPQLLDWLAAEFHSNGGRLKPLHRLIVLSATYRQASISPTVQQRLASSKDADNRLLWHFPRRRLEAEIVRDSILVITGKLNLKMGGPGYDLWKYSNYVLVFEPVDPLPAEAYRRMVYQFKPRTQQDMTFGAFDCPDGTMTIPRRNTSTTALQALNLLNSAFMLDQSKAFAERVVADVGTDATAQVNRCFQLAFVREPNAKELTASVAVVKQHGLAAFCRALLNTNELVFVD